MNFSTEELIGMVFVLGEGDKDCFLGFMLCKQFSYISRTISSIHVYLFTFITFAD